MWVDIIKKLFNKKKKKKIKFIYIFIIKKMNTNFYNILERANNIINNRSEEKNRQYGEMNKSMENSAKIASLFRGKEVDTNTMFCAMIGLKGSRIGHSLNISNDLPSDPDSMCDLVAYIGAYQNYSNDLKKQIKKNDKNLNIKKIYKDLYYNSDEIIVRGLKTKEIMNYQFIIKPYQRFINFESRKLSLKYIKEECLWYLNGDKYDLSICDKAKIWKDLVNEDKTINSNYGYIIFNNNFHRIIEMLIDDKYSRRAVIMIGDNDNLNSITKDYRCTNSIVFSIRKNKLNMFVNMRSNDAIFGVCNDIPFFSILHEMAYVSLRDLKYGNLEYGDYTHYVNSLHVYERHFKMLKKIVLLEEDIKEIDCPKISGMEEVEFLMDTDLEYKPNFKFYDWLNKKN
jgi:thymidylate synthase